MTDAEERDFYKNKYQALISQLKHGGRKRIVETEAERIFIVDHYARTGDANKTARAFTKSFNKTIDPRTVYREIKRHKILVSQSLSVTEPEQSLQKLKFNSMSKSNGIYLNPFGRKAHPGTSIVAEGPDENGCYKITSIKPAPAYKSIQNLVGKEDFEKVDPAHLQALKSAFKIENVIFKASNATPTGKTRNVF
jgi:hypothetical protein